MPATGLHTAAATALHAAAPEPASPRDSDVAAADAGDAAAAEPDVLSTAIIVRQQPASDVKPRHAAACVHLLHSCPAAQRAASADVTCSHRSTPAAAPAVPPAAVVPSDHELPPAAPAEPGRLFPVPAPAEPAQPLPAEPAHPLPAELPAAALLCWASARVSAAGLQPPAALQPDDEWPAELPAAADLHSPVGDTTVGPSATGSGCDVTAGSSSLRAAANSSGATKFGTPASPGLCPAAAAAEPTIGDATIPTPAGHARASA
mmetsp:Transcript_18095/g.59422  ORF Transcript_18095/g.59422 Transcript_18095/m.59422 type:complete len:262 (+) Transcript_18095:1040-1825(+)